MSNSFVAFTSVARDAIKAFGTRLAPLSAFSLDVSDEMAGASVVVPIMPTASATRDLTSDDSGDRTAGLHDVTQTSATVTLGSVQHQTFAVTDVELQNIGEARVADLITKQTMAASNQLADDCLDDCLAYVSNANYSSSIITAVASASFDADTIIDIGSACKALGWRRGKLVVNSDVMAALAKDGILQDLSASGLPTIATGVVGHVGIFDIVECPTLPSTDNLNAICSDESGSGLAIAIRPTLASKDVDYAEVIVDPESGFSYTVSSYYEANFARRIFSIEARWGAAVANTAALKRMTSA